VVISFQQLADTTFQPSTGIMVSLPNTGHVLVMELMDGGDVAKVLHAAAW
jgi:hypothetical protein